MLYIQFKRDMDRIMNKDVITSKEYNEFKDKKYMAIMLKYRD